MDKRTRTARILRDDRGVTLTEILIALAMLGILMSVAVMIFTVVSRTQPQISERAHQIEQGRILMENLIREIREGWDVQTAAPNQLSFSTYVRNSTCGGTARLGTDQAAIACRVTYTCTAGTCARVEAPTSGSGTSSEPYEVVTGLASSDVFSYSPSATSPRYITVTLVFPADQTPDGEGVTLSDGAALRNSGAS